VIQSLRGVDRFDGDVITADHPDYATVIRPAGGGAPIRSPRMVLRCRSEQDVVVAVRVVRDQGGAVAVRSGGHCFAGRSSTEGVLIDVAGLADIDVEGGRFATVGAGTRLGALYPALHAAGRTLPAGCGPTVGIAGLTLGGGIGLLGRLHGLTCDRLVAARVVLADGEVVDCDAVRHPKLFWALRGAGGGQFGIVTSFRFDTVPEPATSPVEIAFPRGVDVERLIAIWQEWAPGAPQQLSLALTLERIGPSPVRVLVSGACVSSSRETERWLADFAVALDPGARACVGDPGPFSLVKATFTDPRDEASGRRLRSGLFARPMSRESIATLVTILGEAAAQGRRRLTFTPMGGAYNREGPDATAFVHRGESYLLEHVGDPLDPWVDASWTVAQGDETPRVYPNFPDPRLTKPDEAYHGGNHARLAAIKRAYDPQRFFDFPHAV
jgi:FAD binding domain/Berberine and berberine like